MFLLLFVHNIVFAKQNNACLHAIEENFFTSDIIDLEKLGNMKSLTNCVELSEFSPCVAFKMPKDAESDVSAVQSLETLKAERTNIVCLPKECTHETILDAKNWSKNVQDLRIKMNHEVLTGEFDLDAHSNLHESLKYLKAVDDFGSSVHANDLQVHCQLGAEFSNSCTRAFQKLIWKDVTKDLTLTNVNQEDYWRIQYMKGMGSSVDQMTIELMFQVHNDKNVTNMNPPLGNHAACMDFGTDYHFCTFSLFKPVGSFCMPTECSIETFAEPSFIGEFLIMDGSLLGVLSQPGFPASWTYGVIQGVDYFNTIFTSISILGSIPPPTTQFRCVNRDTEKHIADLSTNQKCVIAFFIILMVVVAVASLMHILNDPSNKKKFDEDGPYKSLGDDRPNWDGNVLPYVEFSSEVKKYFIDVWCMQDSVKEIFYPGKPVPFPCLDGIRAFSMSWVLMCHAYLFLAVSEPGFSNVGEVYPPGFLSKFAAMPISNGFFSVDSFFFISGFLGAYVCLKKLAPRQPFAHASFLPLPGSIAPSIDRSSWLNSLFVSTVKIPFVYLNRWLRLAIPLFFLQIFHYFIIPIFVLNIEDSDEWQTDSCEGKWFWYNLLLINNYVEPSVDDDRKICLGQAWYLLCDMTIFLFIPWVCVMYHYFHKVGTTALVFLAWVGNMLAVGLWMNKHGCKPNVVIGPDQQPTFSGDCYGASPFYFDAGHQSFDHYTYMETWARYGAMATGILFGLLWDLWLHKVRKFSVPTLIALWSAMLSLFGLLVYGPYTASQSQRDWSVGADKGNYHSETINALYAATFRPLWTVALAIMCLLCFKDQIPFVNWFLSHNFLKPWARVSFIMFLIQFDIMFGFIGGDYWDRMTYNNYFFALYFLGIMCLCFMFSLWIEIIADKPFGKYVKFGMKLLMGLGKPQKTTAKASLASPINSDEEHPKKKRSYLNADLFGGAISDDEDDGISRPEGVMTSHVQPGLV